MIYLQLFFAFLQIGAFSFGGGYAAMPLIQSQVVTTYQWLSNAEFTDLVTISQMTPGPIAINAATFVGEKMAGILGAVFATLGCILPSCLLVTAIAYFYLKYRNLKVFQDVLKVLRPAVVALIATAGLSILITAFFGNTISLETSKIHMIGIYIVSMYLLLQKKTDPILVMVLAGFLNVCIHFIL